MRKLLWIGVLALFTTLEAYWQQDVRYVMHVRLDVNHKRLEARSELTYVNHSPDTLREIDMHLYWNAFNRGTIADVANRKHGWAPFSHKRWTGIIIEQAQLNDGRPISWRIDDDTILRLFLPEPLLPGDTLQFSLEWKSKIHHHYDRSGWGGRQFDFAQWYPKFVVYDENGSHPDPFGEWGEFYGEYGTYDVTLDLPGNYIVAATGIVTEGDPGWSAVAVDTTRPWEEWLKEYEQKHKELEKDSTKRRVVTFHAERVHDFDWLTSPDLVYEHGNWDGIDIHVLFDKAVGARWTKKVVHRGARALQWLSTHFGRYPWPQMTITKALIGGGMEYPMLVMDGSESESLIVHEIGHNWFYGIFGNDELDEPWLDEGFTTFQTRWYLETRYPNREDLKAARWITKYEAENLPHNSRREDDLQRALAYMLSPRNEPIARRSQDFVHSGSYRTNAYTKTSLMLESLKNYLGEERFTKGMKLYFQRWALKHVTEERFIKAMEDGSGQELDWFFDQWLHRKGWVDYSLDSWETKKFDGGNYITTVEVTRKGRYFMPLPVVLYGPQGEQVSRPLFPFRYRKQVIMSVETPFRPVRVALDPDDIFLDAYRLDNGLPHKMYFRPDIPGGQSIPGDGCTLLWRPSLNNSQFTGLKAGLTLRHTYRKFFRNWQLGLWFNTRQKDLDGSLAAEKNFYGLPVNAQAKFQSEKWNGALQVSSQFKLGWARKYSYRWQQNLRLGATYIQVLDSTSTLTQPTSYTILSSAYHFQRALGPNWFIWDLQWSAGPGGWGTWGQTFSSIRAEAIFNSSNGRTPIVLRAFIGADYGSTPQGEQLRLSGITLRERHFRHWESFLDEMGGTDIGSHAYRGGGAGLRGFAAQDSSVRQIVALNVNAAYRLPVPRFMRRLSLAFFTDLAYLVDSGDQPADAGVQLTWQPSWRRTNFFTTWFRPFELSVGFPLVRKLRTTWEAPKFSESWFFTITWRDY